MPRSEIHDKAALLLPSHDREEIVDYVDRALERMERRVLRHYIAEDAWLLNYEERKKIAEAVATLAVLDEAFSAEVAENLRFVADSLQVDIHLVDIEPVVARTRRVMERFLYERGEMFAESILRGQMMLFSGGELDECTTHDLARTPDISSLRESTIQMVSLTIERTLVSHSENAQRYLRAVVDGYTLFAFLRETPNVQSAVMKLFSQGEFWLDTTAVLPLLAERLLSESQRGYSAILRAAYEAGVKFYVTSGVVEEVNGHIDMSMQAWRSPGTWNSRTPFLLQSYIWSGRHINEFPRWLEYFRGSARPTDDLVEFLLQECRIRLLDFGSLLADVPDDLRWQSDAYWHEVHQQRRTKGSGHLETTASDVVRRLALHDSETFLGVIERRKHEHSDNPFGYTTWWLTLDRAAAQAPIEVSSRSGYSVPSSPVISFEFLTYYLMVGPARRQLEKSLEQQLPLAVDTSLMDNLPKDLIAAAEEARRDVEGKDDRLVRRKIRDHLDSEKIRQSKTGRSGLDTIKADLQAALMGSSRPPGR
jgi:hypothetical protein